MSGTLGSLSYNTFRHAGGGFLAFESSLEWVGDRFLNFNIIDYFTSKEVNEKLKYSPATFSFRKYLPPRYGFWTFFITIFIYFTHFTLVLPLSNL